MFWRSGAREENRGADGESATPRVAPRVHHRLAEIDGKSVVVCSTGIGGPSTSIAVEELAQLGVRTFLRVGTTGAIQPHINVGDVLVTTASVRLDGASLHFAPMEFPAVADFACTTALVAAAEACGATTHIGVTASSDTFYPGRSATTPSPDAW